MATPEQIVTALKSIGPAKRIYLSVQLMYIEGDISNGRETYFSLINDFLAAVPSAAEIVNEINNEILTGALYKALKAAHRLIEYEQDLLNHVSARRPGLPADDQGS